ncbi:MAG: hypothetical protein RR365_00675 [Bacteroides sp.]
MPETKKIAIEDAELTPDEEQGQIRTFESDILRGLLAAADFSDEGSVVEIEIARKNVVFFKFRIRPLSEDEYNNCKKKNTKYVRNRQLGIKFPEDTDATRYRSQLIYEATVTEDRVKVWDNKDAWKAPQINVTNGIDMIDKVLLAGEKDAVLTKLDTISGYDSTLEEVAKN